MDDTGVRVVLMTAPEGKAAEDLARALVISGAAACVNRVPGVRSTYRWEGKLCDEPECLLIAKTSVAGLPRLLERVHELHPYSVPEVIALPVVAGAARYLAWVVGECAPEGPA